MPAIHAASVSTLKGKIVTLREFTERGDEYNYYFKNGLIREFHFKSYDKVITSQMDYQAQKDPNDWCELKLQTMRNMDRTHTATVTIRFDDDVEEFNRRTKRIFEEYVEQQLEEVV